ncbi:MAG: glutamate 5-kinase [Anaerococcus vaginalis]|nr:glutamate 5-kinase [Anaerococcus vaginalis]
MREFSNDLKKIVIKVGSSSVSHENGGVDIERIEELAKEIVNLENKGIKVILVSSGAIATGANRLDIKRPRNDISKKQATAAVGQVTLMNTFLKAFAEYGYAIGQILLTRMVETDKVMNFNAKNTINDLLEMGVIPIVNENDTISTYEIDFGDNDTLSSVVARLVDADLLMLLSDIDGLYTDDPRINKDAKLIKEVNVIDEKLRSMGKDSYSKLGTGGMATKINAANLCMEKKIDTVIANSKDLKNIRRIVKGEEIGTIFKRKID